MTNMGAKGDIKLPVPERVYELSKVALPSIFYLASWVGGGKVISWH